MSKKKLVSPIPSLEYWAFRSLVAASYSVDCFMRSTSLNAPDQTVILQNVVSHRDFLFKLYEIKFPQFNRNTWFEYIREYCKDSGNLLYPF